MKFTAISKLFSGTLKLLFVWWAHHSPEKAPLFYQGHLATVGFKENRLDALFVELTCSPAWVLFECAESGAGPSVGEQGWRVWACALRPLLLKGDIYMGVCVSVFF